MTGAYRGRVISIDPGVSGAIAVYDDDETQAYRVQDMPESLADLAALLALECNYGGPVRVILERQQAYPGQAVEGGQLRGGQGVVSAFALGCSYGQLLGIGAALRVPVEIVTPRTWKLFCGLNGIKEPAKVKELARAAAQRIFPLADLHLKKHEGRAEALLIGYWWRERR